MKIVKRYKIGSVNLTQLQGADTDSSRYSDGDSEKVLYDIFASDKAQHKAKEALKNNPEWPIYYHLSPYRKNVIDWYDFEPGASVLEIGAGCGAVTEALCSRDVNVTALELTKRRAEINAHRNKKSKNLEIYIGNLEEYKPTKKFDYIVCVGVLEYAGIFISGDKPYDEFIRLLGSFLTAKGKLIIAIENRLGLKYLSGSREDHTGRFFDGINQYPQPKKVQTFGKVELSEMITASGFLQTEFYYPYPDYKNPQIVYSDNYHPGLNTEFPVKLLPTSSHDTQKRNRVHIFSEQLAMLSVEKNMLYTALANSFVVIAHKSIAKDNPIAFYTNTPNRKEELQIKTYLKKNDSTYTFYKEAMNQESAEHINTIYQNCSKLSKIFKNSKIQIVKATKESDTKLAFEFVRGVTLERKLFEAIVSQDLKHADNLIAEYIQAVELLPGEKSTNQFLVDLNFDNIIIDDNDRWHFIDYEWLLDQEVSKSLIVTRSLFYFINRHSHAFKRLTKRGGYLQISKDWYIPSFIFDKYSAYIKDFKQLLVSEKSFQTFVNQNYNGHPITENLLYDSPTETTAAPDSLEEVMYNPAILAQQQQKIKQLEASRKQLDKELQIQKNKTRRAELTSVYFLPKKVAGKIKRSLSK